MSGVFQMEQEKPKKQTLGDLIGYPESHGYENLRFDEMEAIDDFFNCDKSSMIKIMRDEKTELSKDFRRFIADVLDGKSSPQGRPKNLLSDSEIYQEFVEQLEMGKTQKSISTAIAKKVSAEKGRNITPDAIIKSYKRTKPIMDDFNQFVADISREEDN